MKRIAIFIDGSNFASSFQACGFRPDYARLEELFAQEGEVVGCYYFTALPPREEGNSPLRAVMDYIQYHGWSVISKDTKTYVNNGSSVTKGNMDVEIVVQALKMASYITDLILFSGDGDFRAMVEELQTHGVRVTAVSLLKHKGMNMIADELRRQVNRFIDLRTIVDKICQVKD